VVFMPVKTWRKPLDSDKIKPPKGEVHIIMNRCKGCGYCIEFCPRDVLDTAKELNERGVHPPKVIEENKCTLCGFCTAICPDFAIFTKEKDCKEGC